MSENIFCQGVVKYYVSLSGLALGGPNKCKPRASNLESAAVVSSAKFQTSAYQIIFWCNQGGVLGLFQLNRSKKRFRIQFSFRKGWTIWYGLSHHALLSLSTSYFWIVLWNLYLIVLSSLTAEKRLPVFSVNWGLLVRKNGNFGAFWS